MTVIPEKFRKINTIYGSRHVYKQKKLKINTIWQTVPILMTHPAKKLHVGGYTLVVVYFSKPFTASN